MRKILISLLVSIPFVIAPAVGQAATKVTFSSTSEQQVLVLLNQVRAQHGLSPLAASTQLRSAARFHSADMLQKAYFEHDGLNESWDARVARFIKAPLVGETIAWGSGSYGSA